MNFLASVKQMILPTRSQSILSFEGQISRVAGFGATSDGKLGFLNPNYYLLDKFYITSKSGGF